MNIKLNWFRISNFKGIKDLLVDLKGKNASIYGNNATGKSTTFDAVCWLLFDKDSNNNADTTFKIKPQDADGKDINHLQTVVELGFLVDEKPLKLKKLREEKWVTRRGTTEPVMDGHIKAYWFNEVPCKAREYQTKVDELLDENIFKMITDPLYFNTKLSWQDRRNILLEISGDATDEQVIESDKSLAKLAEVLNGRSIDDYKLVLADQLKGFKKERDDLPPRIDELTRSLPQEEQDYTEVEAELKEFKEGLSQIDAYMTNVTKKVEEVNKKNQELNGFKNQLEGVKAKIKASSGANKEKLIGEKSELENGKMLLSSGIKTLELQIEQANKTLEANAKTRAELLDEWRDLSKQVSDMRSTEFKLDTNSTESTCPTCKQDLPTENIEAQIEQLEANFNKTKLAALEKLVKLTESNKTKGTSLREKTEKINTSLIELQSELAEKEEKLKEITIKVTALDIEIAKPVEEPNYEANKEYILIKKAVEKLQAELDKPAEDDSEYMLKKKADLQEEIDKCNTILNKKEEVAKKKARIEELKAEEKRVSALIAELEGHKFMLERFTVAKVNLLEDSINNQFKHVKFRLFEENIGNDGIRETCVALVNTNGSFVDYNTNGNLAGTYNAGLDIINSLCRFYGVTAPIFFDNRESVSEIIETDSQVINLIKPPTWDELDKEIQEALIKEHDGDIEKAKRIRNDRNSTLRVEVFE